MMRADVLPTVRSLASDPLVLGAHLGATGMSNSPNGFRITRPVRPYLSADPIVANLEVHFFDEHQSLTDVVQMWLNEPVA